MEKLGKVCGSLAEKEALKRQDELKQEAVEKVQSGHKNDSLMDDQSLVNPPH